MSQQAIKIFKLNFDGTFDEIAYENIKDVFTIVNILAIYVQKKKIMYVWIGRNATRSLKNHVAQIREKIKEEFPDYRIIRNITCEMRSEPFEFFENLGITKEELFEQIKYQEKVVIPILDKIEENVEWAKKYKIPILQNPRPYKQPSVPFRSKMIYFTSLLRSLEISQSFINVFNKFEFFACALLSRSACELGAYVYYVEKNF